MVGAVTGLAGYRIELPVPLARKVAPYQRLKAADRAGAVVTGNSDFGAVGSELPRHCRQHTKSARKDPRYQRLSDLGANGCRYGCGLARASPELIENPSQIARFRLRENSLPDVFRCGTLIGVVVAIIVIVVITPMIIMIMIMIMIISSSMTTAINC